MGCNDFPGSNRDSEHQPGPLPHMGLLLQTLRNEAAWADEREENTRQLHALELELATARVAAFVEARRADDAEHGGPGRNLLMRAPAPSSAKLGPELRLSDLELLLAALAPSEES